MKKKVVVFDLDYILIDCNSTFSFVFFYLRTKKRYLSFFFLNFYSLFEKVFPLKFLAVKKREFFISFLKGESLEEIKRIADLFASKVIRERLNEGLYLEYKEKKAKEYFCVLASASLDCVVSAFCSKLDFNVFMATELDFENNVFTGKIKNDLLGLKAEKIEKLEKKIGGINYKESFCYSDNKEDLPLLQKFGNSFGVVKNNSENHFWEEHHIRTLQSIKTFRYNKGVLLFPSFYYFYRDLSLRNFFLLFTTFLVLVLGVYGLLTPLNFLILIISWIGYVSLYEIGYFVNDCISIKKEEKPCYRADKNICSFIVPSILSRFLFFGLVIFILFNIFNISIHSYFLANLFVFIVFLIHNSISVQKRIITLLFLKTTHFWVPLIVFNLNIVNIIILVILFFLSKEVLYYKKKKSGLSDERGNIIARFFTIAEVFILFIICMLTFTGFVSWEIFILAGWLSISNFIKIFNFLLKKEVLLFVSKNMKRIYRELLILRKCYEK